MFRVCHPLHKLGYALLLFLILLGSYQNISSIINLIYRFINMNRLPDNFKVFADVLFL